jgi:hypothetical protein
MQKLSRLMSKVKGMGNAFMNFINLYSRRLAKSFASF